MFSSVYPPLVPLFGYVEQGLTNVNFSNVVHIRFNAEICNSVCGCLESSYLMRNYEIRVLT